MMPELARYLVTFIVGALLFIVVAQALMIRQFRESLWTIWNSLLMCLILSSAFILLSAYIVIVDLMR